MQLDDGWELAASPPDACATPSDAATLGWEPARVPGTAAGATGDGARDFDAEDWWFRCRFSVPDDWLDRPLSLDFGGIATVAEVFLDDALVLRSESMWAAHTVALDPVAAGDHELALVCRALAPRLARRRRPAPRWRTRVVSHANLRWYRTMMFGRSPGFSPGPAAVGPWRPVRVRRADELPREALSIRTHLEDGDGVVIISIPQAREGMTATARLGEFVEPLQPSAAGLTAVLRVPQPELWWPHTHGCPALHELIVELDGQAPIHTMIGFRELVWPGDIARDGLALAINGVPLFVRGAVWTPADLMSMAPSSAVLRRLLTRLRDAGMNMVRVVGTGAYESPTFHELCDELGILVWQDLMFANLDYPLADPDFRAGVEAEAHQVVSDIAGHPSTTVICGNSEVEQQPAMMGLDPAAGRDRFWEETVAGIVTDSGAGCAYLRSTPHGGVLPFHPTGGTAHYFAVSGYFAPPHQARRDGVQFAAEALAFAHVPDDVAVPVHHPDWKRGVVRDAGTGWDVGAGWDFDDVRDHYLRLIFGVDPVALRRYDHERYLELSRLASGEVMSEVMGEWRRSASPCRGALVLWFKDMAPGAGLGIIDHTGRPKLPYHLLKRVLQPVCVWLTDEGVSGVAVHVANDRPRPFDGTLRVSLYRHNGVQVDEESMPLLVGPHTTIATSVEAVLGRFVDAAWAYRFGPPVADAVVASLQTGETQPISQAIHFPAGRPVGRMSTAQLGLRASARQAVDGAVQLELTTAQIGYGMRVAAAGFEPDDDGFWTEPDRPRLITLHPNPQTAPGVFHGATLAGANLEQPLAIAAQPS